MTPEQLADPVAYMREIERQARESGNDLARRAASFGVTLASDAKRERESVTTHFARIAELEAELANARRFARHLLEKKIDTLCLDTGWTHGNVIDLLAAQTRDDYAYDEMEGDWELLDTTAEVSEMRDLIRACGGLPGPKTWSFADEQAKGETK